MDRIQINRAIRAVWASIAGIALLLGAVMADGADLDVRLRVTWGGGSPRSWSGSLSLSEGTCAALRSLGVEADGPLHHDERDDGVRFWEPAPVTFDGLDVQVECPETAQFIIELNSGVSGETSQHFEIPVASFAKAAPAVWNQPVDETGNYLTVERVPGDALRVELDREHLVFRPGESFKFKLKPQHLGLPSGTHVGCALELHKASGKSVLWEAYHTAQVDDSGSVDWIGPEQFELPVDEGVYELDVVLQQRRFPDALGAFVPGREILRRRVQLVSVGPRVPVPRQVQWREVDVIDLTSREWWSRWMWLPQFDRLSLLDPMSRGKLQRPLGEGEIRRIERGGAEWLEIGGGAWYAAPIPIAEIGQPHLLEVRYPRGVRQTLGIGVIEPDAAGHVTGPSPDSGLDVSDSLFTQENGEDRYRLVFWPKTKTPWLLLTNRDPARPAVFGKIRVESGPEILPPLQMDVTRIDERLLLAYFDRPLFPENFAAPRNRDEPTQQAFDDWNTFLEGGLRLSQYLHFAGYNGAIVSAVRDGSVSYPSRILPSTPKYDRGAFFSDGRDVVQKDVLELLFRLFDRANLRLVPAVRFAMPLPELEERLRQDEKQNEGIELVGIRGETGQVLVGRQLTVNGAGPYYNPLDPRVQAAMGRVVGELVERYAHHPSFGGICVQLDPSTYSALPGTAWPLDDRTMERFQADTGIAVPQSGADRFARRATFLQWKERKAWLDWRSRRLAALFEDMAEQIAGFRTDARLYLATENLLSESSASYDLRPRLLQQSDATDIILRHGVLPEAFSENDRVVMLRPQRHGPLTPLVTQAVNLNVNQLSTVDQAFRAQPIHGALHYHESHPVPLPAFDRANPLGSSVSQTRLNTYFSLAGSRNRARFVHSIATLDAQILVDGGTQLPLGQEDSLRPLFEVFRRLPGAPFRTWEPLSPSARGSNVTVRTLSRGSRTFLYVVNDGPWAADVQLYLKHDGPLTAQPLGQRSFTPPSASDSGTVQWHLSLQPYDLMGAVLDHPNVEVADWEVTYAPEVRKQLGELVQGIRARVNELRSPRPLKVLANPGFEADPQGDEIPGWFYSQRPGVSVSLDAQRPKKGERSLHIRVDQPRTVAWVRSKPFAPPKTGRIFVLAWIRTRDADKQPPLRLAIDGLVNGRPYYRFAPLGVDVHPQTGQPTGQPAQSVPEDWSPSPFLLPIDDLPTSGLTELLVGFDLMGPGEVWIDDVQVFDLYFQVNEQDQLLKSVAMADFHLDKGRIADCTEYLEGYWPRFLLEYVPEPARVATVPAARTATAERAAASENEESRDWSRFIPRVPFQLPFRSRR